MFLGKLKSPKGGRMQQFIASRVLTVNNEPSPCNCTEGVVCPYCTQASLIIWDRNEHPEEDTRDRVLKAIIRNGPRKTARLLGVQASTVTRWLKKKSIPESYMIEIQKTFEIAA